MTFLYVSEQNWKGYKSEKKKKDFKKSAGLGNWWGLLGEERNKETAKGNCQISDLHTSLGGDAFHWDKEEAKELGKKIRKLFFNVLIWRCLLFHWRC